MDVVYADRPVPFDLTKVGFAYLCWTDPLDVPAQDDDDEDEGPLPIGPEDEPT